MKISICICTYNRANILKYCLRSLCDLSASALRHEVEIVVVDNNSSDGTRDLVASFVSECPFELNYVFEGEQGIAAARNRAIAEAKGDYVAFLDDECTVGPDWLSIALADIDQYRPCVIGGPYMGAFLPGDRPGWFKIEYGNAYFLAREYEKGFQNDFRASSGNMFVRRDVFDAVLFDLAYGMKGKKLALHEETELQERFLRDHPTEKIFYDPEMVVWHFILPEKMRLVYHAKRTFVAALTGPGKVDHAGFLISLSKTFAHLTFAPISWAWRNRKVHPSWKNVAYERTIPRTGYHAGLVAKYIRAYF
ncbi:glycosyltransferase family 2 protein [Bradyrhizobium sp.]|uniref:glycosyltransferase family 2 protein n=1 Tax=Bradyrhizobium sp. TaxID=376 RepID=UPI0039E361E1